ncbi:hypothetical protein VTN31DRAFT_2413 [Thermomyces dupontii]|uniref:uncharacterized protein n=1 Tax=Talaromyces thermophilus TaxID=28565 RepID=UPI003743C1F1
MPPVSHNTTSPARRPGLARRSASSQAVNSTRTSPASGTEAVENTTHPQHHNPHPTHHKPKALHRPHVVGGAHRRNTSLGKNLSKLARQSTAHNLQVLGDGARHQRKKSAPVTPAGSPRGSRGEGDSSHKHMRKNYSTPALHRNTSAVLGKKTVVADRPQSAKGRRKSVGFELGDPDSDEEWEDSPQSPESTRRGSVAPSGKESEENTQVLVDPLTFVKRPNPQLAQSRSLPESDLNRFTESHREPQEEQSSEEESSHSGDESAEERESQAPTTEKPSARHHESEDAPTRLLSQPRPSRAPPAMSSVSAVVTPAPVDTARRNESLTQLATSHDVSREGPAQSSGVTAQQTPQGTSSSMEGGVSRFITNDRSGTQPASRTDSDPNTPSSFLPHYHPQSPLSSQREKKVRTISPPPRPPGDGPPSRTQQKLWLQRTATLTTSPPDPHGTAGLPTSSIDPMFMGGPNGRLGGRLYDGSRPMNGTARGGAGPGGEAKHLRRAYERSSTELNVVRRFHQPTRSSFNRVDQLISSMKQASLSAEGGVGSNSNTNNGNGSADKNSKSAPASSAQSSATISSSPTQKRRKPGRVYFHEQDDVVAIGEEPGALSSSTNAAAGSDPRRASKDGGGDEDRDGESYFATEKEMLLRRMWESRGEVASPG